MVSVISSDFLCEKFPRHNLKICSLYSVYMPSNIYGTQLPLINSVLFFFAQAASQVKLLILLFAKVHLSRFRHLQGMLVAIKFVHVGRVDCQKTVWKCIVWTSKNHVLLEGKEKVSITEDYHALNIQIFDKGSVFGHSFSMELKFLQDFQTNSNQDPLHQPPASIEPKAAFFSVLEYVTFIQILILHSTLTVQST